MSHVVKASVEARIGKVSCSGNRDDYFELTISDKASGITFVALELTQQEFANMITGSCVQPKEGAELRGLQFVGMKYVSERRSVQAPDIGYKSRDYEKWLKENYREDGWFVHYYLGGQGSISPPDAKTKMKTLYFSVYKYVPVETECPGQ